MALNKADRKEVIKIATDKGYKQSASDPDKMIKDNGKWVKISETGNSVTINSYGGYNTVDGARKSSKW